MEYAGALSGAALGFIHHGVPGARTGAKFGWRAGENFTKNSKTMAPITRSQTGNSKPRKPVNIGAPKSIKPKGSRRKNRSNRSSVYRTQNDGDGITTAASKRKGKSVKKEGVKKTVKVSKQFRKKVKQSLVSDGFVGTMMETHTEILTPNTNGQFLHSLGRSSQNTKVYFDPCNVLNVASVLYNQKPLTFSPALGDAGNFDFHTFQCHVIKQHVTHRLKNNTARTLTLKIYDVSPKGKQFADGFNPLTFWQDAMINEIGGTDLNRRVNIAQASPSTLYCNPKLCQGFKQNYTIDETIVNLESGKEYNHKLVGPNDMEYKFQKFFDARPGNTAAGVFCNQQKFVKMTFIVMYGDLVTGALETPPGVSAARKIALNSSGGEFYGLAIESTVYTKVKIPEQAGFNNPPLPVPQTQPLNNRKSNPYVLQNWKNTLGNDYNTVVDEQPATDPVVGSK